MNPATEKSPGRLRLPSSLEIYNVESVQRALLEGLANQPELLLDLGQVETCDAAGLQLLCSVRQTATLTGKVARLEHLTPPILECCARLGISAELFTNPPSASL